MAIIIIKLTVNNYGTYTYTYNRVYAQNILDFFNENYFPLDFAYASA